jgi:AcrR family transcriptional regulator
MTAKSVTRSGARKTHTKQHASEPLGLRDRKKLEAERTLAKVAKKAFEKRGFDAVTVEEIAAAANVSKRTFFRYFPTKEDVFFGRRRAQLEALESALVPLADETPFATVRRALLSVSSLHLEAKDDVLREHRVLARSPALLARDLEWDRRAQELVAEALARSGDPRRARLVSGAIVGVLRVVIEDWVQSEGALDLEAEGIEALDLLARTFEDARGSEKRAERSRART